ncbi:MAG: hypothetical protein JW888_07090 [Pirellulales bacterium]|nr:hypothetical protein [Pirellulales bacterium]
MPDSGNIPILLLGDWRRREFHQARTCLDRWAPVAETPSIDEAVALVDSTQFMPAVIVVAQAYPGEFSGESLDRLRRRLPLARIVGLLGSWCEGETRTGHPWPATIRLYWHQWIAQCHRELDCLSAGSGSTWSLPSTATDEERLLTGPSGPFDGREGLIALCAERYETHEWLTAAARRRGYSTVWLRPHERVRIDGAKAAVFNGSAFSDYEVAQLRQLRKNLGPAVPIVALADFPRVEDRDRAVAAGAGAVLSKPLLLDDLYWQLDQLIKPAN